MISLVATVNAPRSDLERFVHYYLNIGIDRLYLFFDDPLDPALSAFAGLPQVTATASTPEGWRAAGISPEEGIEVRQIHNANLALSWARAEGAGWLLHVDVDELIHSPGDDISAWVAAVSPESEVVHFPVLEAIPWASSRRHPFEACWLFKTSPPDQAARLALAARAGRLRALRYGYFRGHAVGKSALRLAARIRSVGIHAPSPAEGAPPLKSETATDVFLLHYDGCVFEAWREKWARRTTGAGAAKNMRPSRRRQLADFMAADESGSAAALAREFRAQCLVPLHEQAILWALGLARPLRVRRDLFRPGVAGAIAGRSPAAGAVVCGAKAETAGGRGGVGPSGRGRAPRGGWRPGCHPP